MPSLENILNQQAVAYCPYNQSHGSFETQTGTVCEVFNFAKKNGFDVGLIFPKNDEGLYYLQLVTEGVYDSLKRLRALNSVQHHVDLRQNKFTGMTLN